MSLLERLESLPDVPEWTPAAALERWTQRVARCELPEAATKPVDNGAGEPVSSGPSAAGTPRGPDRG